MSEIKHTPGPLTVRIRRPVFKGLCVETTDGRVCTAEVYGTENSNEIDDAAWANAYLYAAAPELLKACEALAHWDECWPSAALEGALRKARAAIAKAKGETA